MISILVVCTEFHDSTSFYRAAGPFSHLRKWMPEIRLVCPSQVTWAEVYQHDVVFCLRPQSLNNQKILTMAKDLNKPVWVDFDDDLTNVPSSNPACRLYHKPEVINAIGHCIKMADIVTVSTKQLADTFSGLNKSIRVIPNAIDTDILTLQRNTAGKRENSVLWRGSSTHDEDLAFYTESIAAAANRHKETKFLFMGNPFWWTMNQMPTNAYQTEPRVILEYFKALAQISPKIMQVPLVDLIFNRSKSNICHLEAAWAGAMTLAPDWFEWNLPGVVHYKDPKDYLEKLSMMIEMSEEESDKKANQSWQYILESLTLNKVNMKRKDVLEELLS